MHRHRRGDVGNRANNAIPSRWRQFHSPRRSERRATMPARAQGTRQSTERQRERVGTWKPAESDSYDEIVKRGPTKDVEVLVTISVIAEIVKMYAGKILLFDERSFGSYNPPC